MNILDLKRKALGWMAMGTGDGTNGTGDGTNNGGDSNSGPTGGNYGGGGSRNTSSYSGYTTGQESDPSSPSYDHDYASGNGAASSAAASPASVSPTATSSQTPAQAAAKDMISRDVLGTTTSDPDAPSDTDPDAPKTATQTLAQQVRLSVTDPATAPSWTGTRAERDARAAGNMAAGNADGSPAGQKGGYGTTGMYNATTSYADLKTKQEEGKGAEDAPGTTSQTVDQALASKKVHSVLNATVPTLARAAVSAINPTFGLVWGAADAAVNKNLPGFAGSAAGRYAASALGVPALGGLFGELGSSVATGKTPDLGKVAAGTLGGYIGSRVGQEVGQSAGPIAGTVAGSLAKNATNFGAAKALGR